MFTVCGNCFFPAGKIAYCLQGLVVERTVKKMKKFLALFCILFLLFVGCGSDFVVVMNENEDEFEIEIRTYDAYLVLKNVLEEENIYVDFEDAIGREMILRIDPADDPVVRDIVFEKLPEYGFMCSKPWYVRYVGE